jgi:hypothetical protein
VVTSALGRSAAFAASTPLASGETATAIRVGGDTNSGCPRHAPAPPAGACVKSRPVIGVTSQALESWASLRVALRRPLLWGVG